MSEQPPHCIVAIVPCNDIEASTAFYSRLGLSVHSDFGSYRILSDGNGWLLHLSSESPEGWVVPGRNPNGVYLYLEDVDGLTARVSDLIVGVGPEHKPWGMYEFALSDPDGTLVRIGWPSRLMGQRSDPFAERRMADPVDIYNWRRLDDTITTSGQPTEAQLADIKALGVQHIVNLALHTHEKALPDEAGSVRGLGMTYTHIPVDFQNPTDQDFEQFCAAMEQCKDAPIHVHCIANYRVSAFFYRYRRDVLGWDDARARADMDAIWNPEGVWAAFVR